MVKKYTESALKLIGSFTLFKKFFYEELTKRPYIIVQPPGRQPRQILVARELTKVQRMETRRLILNIGPGSGKSTEVSFFIAWCYARYPDCNNLYISVTEELAEKNTHIIKRIMQLPSYREMFHVELRKDSSAKGAFITTDGGSTKAFGAGGTIIGQDAGLPHVKRYSGGIFLDDMHKPKDIFSDTIREEVIENFHGTILKRARSPITPIVAFGQRLHEADLFAHILNGGDGHEWKHVILKTLDDAGNNLMPDVISTEDLLIMKEIDEYNFWSQHQQNPQPAGGGIFKTEWFVQLDFEPEILTTFITADTAETNKDWNDATVFAFWGIYKVIHEGIEIDMYAVHCLDCIEIRIEPKDMQSTFLNFYASCMRHRVKPKIAAIEKKSTGVTLCSVLKDMPGLQVIEIERTRASGGKTQRFMEIQPYIAAKQVTFTRNSRHFDLCVNHMTKITKNNTHAHDDICDNFADAVKLALIDKVIYSDDSSLQSSLNLYTQASKRLSQRVIGAWN